MGRLGHREGEGRGKCSRPGHRGPVRRRVAPAAVMRGADASVNPWCAHRQPGYTFREPRFLPLSEEARSTGMRQDTACPCSPDQKLVFVFFFQGLNEPSSHRVRNIPTGAPAKNALTKRSGSRYSGVRAWLCTKTNTKKNTPDIPSKASALCCQFGCRRPSTKVAVKKSRKARRPIDGSTYCILLAPSTP